MFFSTLFSSEKQDEHIPLQNVSAHQVDEPAGMKDYSTSSKPRKTKDTVSYRKCSLQSDPETPYFVALSAAIFGLESSNDQENTIDAPFEWVHNDRISEDQFDATNKSCLWTHLPASIFSMNHMLCLNGQLNEKPRDFLIAWTFLCAVPLVTSLFVEISIVNALRSYEDFDMLDKEMFCNQDWNLQCGVIGVFLISLLRPMLDILSEICVLLFSKRCVFDTLASQQLFIVSAGAEYGRGRKFCDMSENSLIVKDVRASWLSLIICWIAIAGEVYVFYLTVLIGMCYTLSQSDASSIVQAAVAISFINQIDNTLYDAIASEEIKRVIETCRFEIPLLRTAESNGVWQFCIAQRDLILQVPLLMVLTATVVFSLRLHHCGEAFGPTFEDIL